MGNKVHSAIMIESMMHMFCCVYTLFCTLSHTLVPIRGRSRNFKRGGSGGIFFKKGGSNHLLGSDLYCK